MTTPTKRHSLPPRPLHLSISTIDTFSRTSSGSDIVSSSPTTSSLSKRPATKRQQSISYLPHNSDPRWSIRSPTAAASPLSISPEGRNSPASPASQRENTPLTLAEKHADLLRFIAQKESKCMELRTQLASQEAELIQLKRKWERIVNRGFDRVYAANGITPPQSAPGPVLEGIKEGVQEVSRMIAAGLGEYGSAPPIPTNPASAPPRTHSTHQSTSSVTTSYSGSTRLSYSSANSSLFEDDFPMELPEEGEVFGKKDQVRIIEDVSQPTTCTPILEESTAVDISKTSSDEDRIPKSLRRRSRDVSPEARGKLSKFSQARQREGRSPVLPTSSMPGLGTLPSGTPSWVLGTVGKKWEELQRTETFTKSQKRASVLLADMSQSLLNAWSAPTQSPVIGASISTNPFVASISPTQTESPIPERLAAQTSLLDDDGDLQLGHAGGLGVVMKPDSKSPPASVQNKGDDDEEDWNW